MAVRALGIDGHTGIDAGVSYFDLLQAQEGFLVVSDMACGGVLGVFDEHVYSRLDVTDGAGYPMDDGPWTEVVLSCQWLEDGRYERLL